MDDHKLDNTGKKSSALARGGKKSGQWLLAHPLGALQLLGLVLLSLWCSRTWSPPVSTSCSGHWQTYPSCLCCCSA